LVEAGSAWLVVVLGVVALSGQHRDVALIGAEVGAGLADRFVVAVHGGWSLTPSVAEHALMLLAEPAHVGPFGIGGELGAVEVVDFGGDVEVFVGDGVNLPGFSRGFLSWVSRAGVGGRSPLSRLVLSLP